MTIGHPPAPPDRRTPIHDLAPQELWERVDYPPLFSLSRGSVAPRFGSMVELAREAAGCRLPVPPGRRTPLHDLASQLLTRVITMIEIPNHRVPEEWLVPTGRQTGLA